MIDTKLSNLSNFSLSMTNLLQHQMPTSTSHSYGPPNMINTQSDYHSGSMSAASSVVTQDQMSLLTVTPDHDMIQIRENLSSHIPSPPSGDGSI